MIVEFCVFDRMCTVQLEFASGTVKCSYLVTAFRLDWYQPLGYRCDWSIRWKISVVKSCLNEPTDRLVLYGIESQTFGTLNTSKVLQRIAVEVRGT